MAFRLCEATETDARADARAIATLFSLSWASPFAFLQFGRIDRDELVDSMTPAIKECMRNSATKYVIMRDCASQGAVSCAQWTMPMDDERGGCSADGAASDEEEREMQAELLWNRLPEKSNKKLIVDFSEGLQKMRKRVVAGRKHYSLENLATHPCFRRRGLAKKLIEWAFPLADTNHCLVYLETASDNGAIGLYKSLGFRDVDSSTIPDLVKHGGEGSHTHIALARVPSSTV